MSLPHDLETPLEILKSAFSRLREKPEEMTLRLPPVPAGPVDRVMDLERIIEVVSDRGSDPVVRALVWQQVMRKARMKRGDWLLIAAGLAYPKLVHKSQRLAAQFPGDTQEDQADLIAAFFQAVSEIDLESTEIYDLGATAVWRAFNTVRRDRRRTLKTRAGVLDDGDVIQAPHVANPDILLARAVRSGVLTEKEAEYIGRSHLEGADADEIAAWAGISRSSFFRYRAAAEHRLVEAIRNGRL
jgi:predicted DNA-binding protein (UPF0251 family)